MGEEKEIEIVNAKIDSISLGFDRGVFLSAWLHLDYGGVHQGFGGFCLAKKEKPCFDQGPYAGHFIARCLEIADVEEWDQLKGKTIRVKKESGWSGSISAIGHILKDDWFSPSSDFQQNQTDNTQQNNQKCEG